MRSAVFLLFAAFLIGVGFTPGQTPVSAPTPAVATDVQKGYLVGPGDEITGKVLGETEFDFVATVDEDGKIEVPFFDKPVVAKCRTERELRSDIGGLLAKYLKNPQLSVRVTDRKSRPPATVYGEVRQPQQVTLMRRATLVELIAFSGGVTDQAGGEIQVFRTRPPLCADPGDQSDWKVNAGDPTDIPSRVYSISSVRAGKEDSNPVIFPGDVIIVQKASPVYITGEVVAPQGIYLKEGGMSLTEAIAKIGGVRREAKTKDIKIYRQKPGSKEREVIAANYDEIRKGLQKDVMLQAYDIVEVDHASKSVGQTILEFATGVARAGVMSVSSGLGTAVLY